MTNRRTERFEGRHFFAVLALVMLIWVGIPASGQTGAAMPTPNGSANPTATPNMRVQDDDAKQWQIAAFDKFLDGHSEIAEQLRTNPSLVNNEEFVENHPALQQYLQQHPGVREEIKENPNAFMHREQRFDQREEQRENEGNRGDRDSQPRQIAAFDRFLDSHPELAEQVQKNPSLVNNEDFVETHPALQQYLQQHPGVRQEITENPNAFMRQEQRFDRNENRPNTTPDRDDHRATAVDRDERNATMDRDGRTTVNDRDNRGDNGTTIVGAGARSDRDATTSQLGNADRFFDSHPEISEQLSKNPSLINNEEFVANHPALQQYLQSHPGVREEIKENPNAFMHREQQFDQREAIRDRGEARGEMTSFGEFLGAHANIAQELSKNPSLANNKEYLESHPELREYLKAHPTMQSQLTANPQTVMSSVQASNATKSASPKPNPKH